VEIITARNPALVDGVVSALALMDKHMKSATTMTIAVPLRAREDLQAHVQMVESLGQAMA